MFPRKGHKYRAQRTVYNGHNYPSKAEATRAAELDVMKASSLIRDWTGQPKFELGVPENRYIADFLVTGADGEQWVEDVKGFQTPVFRKSLRLWKSYGPHELRLLKRSGNGWKFTIIPKGKKVAA